MQRKQGVGGCGRPGCTRCGQRRTTTRAEDDSLSSTDDDAPRPMLLVRRNGTNHIDEEKGGEKTVVDHHHQPTYHRAMAATEARLAQHGLERVRIDADGNCMFRAIAAFFRHPAVTHTAVRRLIVDYIASNADRFRVDVECDWASLEHYCREMRRAKTWGDATALSAFCMAQNVNIVVFGEHGFSELYPGDGRVKLALVHVDGHYDATRVIAKR